MQRYSFVAHLVDMGVDFCQTVGISSESDVDLHHNKPMLTRVQSCVVGMGRTRPSVFPNYPPIYAPRKSASTELDASTGFDAKFSVG